MEFILHKAEARGRAEYDWLKTFYSFSFSEYFNPNRVNFGVLRVLNDDWIAGGKGFGMHPHDNMEIVTIMLEGELKHSDSMGHTQVLYKDEVQVMSAGTGIYHAEANNLPDVPIQLFQIWVFPEKKNIQPRYDQKYFDPSARDNQWQTIAGPGNDGGHLEIKQNAWFSRANLSENNTLNYAMHNPKNGLFLFVLEGSVSIDEKIKLERRDAAALEEINNISILANTQAEVLAIEVPMQ